MDRLITVTGAGKATAKPDQVRIEGNVSGKCREYAEAVRASAQAVSELRRAIGEAGFDMDMLKTTGISVSASYRQVERDGVYRSEFDGFSYSHGIRMTADAGEEGLGRLLQAMMGCTDAPEFHVSYVVTDPSAPMAEARRNAVRDAECRARELADAAGVTLGGIVSISYVSSPCNVSSGRMRTFGLANGMTDGLVPEDAEYNDSVTVEWEILRSRRGMLLASKVAAVAAVIVVAAVAAVAVLCMTGGDEDVPSVTVGDMTVTGGIAGGDFTADEYAGVGTITYGGTGLVEWYVKDADGTDYVKTADPGTYRLRDFERASAGNTLTVDDPGRYDVRMYVDGELRSAGMVYLDGTVTKTFTWRQTVHPTEVHGWSITFTYRYSDYVEYADRQEPRYRAESLDDSRFVAVDDRIRLLEDLLRAEYMTGHADLDRQDYADYLLSFVQCCIAYPAVISPNQDGTATVSADGSPDYHTNGTVEYWSYPMETLHLGVGDCEDTSALAAALFSAAGYTTGVAVIPNHMVAFVGLDGFTPRYLPGAELTVKTITATGTNIFFCETADERAVPAGYLSKEHSDNVKALTDVPVVGPDSP